MPQNTICIGDGEFTYTSVARTLTKSCGLAYLQGLHAFAVTLEIPDSIEQDIRGRNASHENMLALFLENWRLRKSGEATMLNLIRVLDHDQWKDAVDCLLADYACKLLADTENWDHLDQFFQNILMSYQVSVSGEMKKLSEHLRSLPGTCRSCFLRDHLSREKILQIFESPGPVEVSRISETPEVELHGVDPERKLLNAASEKQPIPCTTSKRGDDFYGCSYKKLCRLTLAVLVIFIFSCISLVIYAFISTSTSQDNPRYIEGRNHLTTETSVLQRTAETVTTQTPMTTSLKANPLLSTAVTKSYNGHHLGIETSITSITVVDYADYEVKLANCTDQKNISLIMSSQKSTNWTENFASRCANAVVHLSLQGEFHARTLINVFRGYDKVQNISVNCSVIFSDWDIISGTHEKNSSTNLRVVKFTCSSYCPSFQLVNTHFVFPRLEKAEINGLNLRKGTKFDWNNVTFGSTNLIQLKLNIGVEEITTKFLEDVESPLAIETLELTITDLHPNMGTYVYYENIDLCKIMPHLKKVTSSRWPYKVKVLESCVELVDLQLELNNDEGNLVPDWITFRDYLPSLDFLWLNITYSKYTSCSKEQIMELDTFKSKRDKLKMSLHSSCPIYHGSMSFVRNL